MEEKNKNLTDEQLSQQLRKSKGGKWGGMLLSLLGGVIVFAGIVQGGNLVLIVAGVVILALGQTAKGKSREQAGRQTFDALAPDIVSTVFDNIQMDPAPHILDAKDTNIPLPGHTYCTVRLTEVNEFQREETGQWEKNEREVYTGQWMLCELNREFPTWLTIWPRERMDKLFGSKTIRTGNEAFDKRFNVSSDDEAAALHILTPDCAEKILALADSPFGKFAINLNSDGRLYLAVHSGHGFFDLGKGREDPAQLRQRFTRELTWFTNMIDVFRGA